MVKLFISHEGKIRDSGKDVKRDFSYSSPLIPARKSDCTSYTHGEIDDKIKVVQGEYFAGMLVGRKREDGFREFYMGKVWMIYGRPCNVMLIKENDAGFLMPETKQYL